MAKDLKFLKGIVVADWMKKYGVVFRASKTAESIGKAVHLSMKNGHGRTENELEFLELYLSQVFKRAPAGKKA